MHKNEALNRVLLLMKYDNRQTLSENVEKITLFEQYSATNEKLWSSVNSGDENSIRSYSCQLSKMSFAELANLFKLMAPKSGVISPDLIGYGIYNKPTIASTILENEIYVRRVRKQDSFYEIMIPLKKIINTFSLGQQAADTSNEIGRFPESLENQLLDYRVIGGKPLMSSSSYYANKPATLICDEGVIPANPKKSKPEVKPKTSLDLSGISDRKTMWKKLIDDWKKKNPGVPSTGLGLEDLRKDSPKKDYGMSFYRPDWIKLYKENPNYQFDSGLGTNIYDMAKSAGYSEQQSNQILSKFGTKNEKSEIQWKKFQDSMTKDEQVKKENEEYEKLIQDSKGDIISNKIVKRVFPNVDELIKDEDCKTQYLKFFKGIIDGSVRNKNGKVVGKAYYNSKNKLYYAKWDEPTPPCTNEWWDKYGMYIQIGAAIAAGIIFPAAGWGLIAQTAVDMGLGVYSLKQAVKKQDPAQVNIEIIFTFLPLLMVTTPVRAAIERLKYSKKTIDSLTNKLKGFDKLNRSQREVLLNQTLTSEEKRALMGITTNPELRQILKNETDEIVQNISKSAKNAKVSKVRWFADPIVNILVYGGSFLSTYIYNKINEVDQIVKKRFGRPINEDEKKFFELLFAYLSEKDSITFIQGGLSVVNDDKFKEVIKLAGETGKTLENIMSEENKKAEKAFEIWQKNAEKADSIMGTKVTISSTLNPRVNQELNSTKEKEDVEFSPD